LSLSAIFELQMHFRSHL